MDLLPPGGSIAEGSIKLGGRELIGLSRSDMRRIRGNEIALIFQDPAPGLLQFGALVGVVAGLGKRREGCPVRP